MEKFRRQKIKLPVFNYEVVVDYVDSVAKHVKERFPKVWDEGGWEDNDQINGMHFYSSRDCASFIIIHKDPSIKTIAHEVYHTVWKLMDHIGAKHENEVMAYHIGHLVFEISENIWNHSPAGIAEKIKAKKALTRKKARRKVV